VIPLERILPGAATPKDEAAVIGNNRGANDPGR
jgi:hypothetical protein